MDEENAFGMFWWYNTLEKENLIECSKCGKEISEDSVVYCDMCGVPLCEECGNWDCVLLVLNFGKPNRSRGHGSRRRTVKREKKFEGNRLPLIVRTT